MSRVNLFIIGVNKAGTSWLYHLLKQHSEVFMSEVKELYFFGNNSRGPKDYSAYHAHFPFDDGYRYYGEATPMYYRDPSVAEALYEYNPDARLLAIVRDPIQRLLSQYRYHKQIGLLDEETRLTDALNDQNPKLIYDSHYERTLPPFIEQFGSRHCTIVSLEEGKDNPSRMWNQLLATLDLSPDPYPAASAGPENPTGGKAFRHVYRRLIPPIQRHLPHLYRWMLQSKMVRQAKRGLIQLLGTADEETIPNEVHDRLRHEFAPTYRYLEELGFDHYPSP